MAVSSTHAGELALEAQEVLLAEQEHETHETPRLCSAHLRGTAAKSLLALTLVWLTACFMTVVLLKLDWQILLKCLPGCFFGLSSVLMFSYEEKQYQSTTRYTSAPCLGYVGTASGLLASLAASLRDAVAKLHFGSRRHGSGPLRPPCLDAQ